ncbi:MAG: enolase [Candidatus Thermoplasmatota archaeon]|jgi:enolase|nr:enolase [Candidatus Thermoplasmatota archaeon]
MSGITGSKVRKILDSRGNETVEVEIFTEYGHGIAAAPSGASKGSNEVKDYPEGGIDQSLKIFRSEISRNILGMESSDQAGFDRYLESVDGTGNFSSIGGNLAVALSLANACAAADEIGVPLFRYLGGMNGRMPVPLGNVVGGGKHAVNGTTIQEFLIASHSNDVYEAIRTNSMVHKRIKEKASKGLDIPVGMGDEKAWVLPFDDEKVIAMVKEIAEEISDKTGLTIENGMDLAASNFYEDGHYVYRGKKLTPAEQVDFVEGIVRDMGYTIIEDPFDENDFESFAELTKRVGDRAIIIGDDIYTTNYERLQEGIGKVASNAILLKPNQVGTLSRLLKTWRLAKDNGMSVVVSHRSGETTDHFISHLAVAIGADYLKTGTVGGERIAKLNELVRIQEEMGGQE